MTSTTFPAATGIRTWPVYAAGSAGLATILSALAYYADVFGPTEEGPSDPVWQWLIVVGITVAIGLGVFVAVVRTATPANAGRRGLIIALVGLPSVWAFWSGLPVMLGAAAACCALAYGRPSRAGMVALVLAAVVVALGVWGALTG